MQLKWTAMAGSKQSHGWLINDLCPLMVHPVVPQHPLFLLFAEGPIEDLVLQHFPRSLNHTVHCPYLLPSYALYTVTPSLILF